MEWEGSGALEGSQKVLFLVIYVETIHDNIAGSRFGRLTAIELTRHATGLFAWKCRCDCGNETIVRAYSLYRGVTKSCGCIVRTQGGLSSPNNKKGRAIYNSWVMMQHRCYDQARKDYRHYGGRGIKVCDRWLIFQNFYDDMAESHFYKASVDRIDVNGDYSPANCRWATQAQQVNNTRMTNYVTAFGETLSRMDWAARTGIPYKVLKDRISKLGWPPELALSTPVLEHGVKRRHLSGYN